MSPPARRAGPGAAGPVPGFPGASGGRAADRIELRGLRVLGTHGVLPEEKVRPQPFEIDIDLVVDLEAASRSDRLPDTVDYSLVAASAVAVVGGPRPYELLEALAGAVAASVLAADGRIAETTVSLRKLEPPMAVDIGTVGVRITRAR